METYFEYIVLLRIIKIRDKIRDAICESRMITFVSNYSEISQRFVIFRDCFLFSQTITILYARHTTCTLCINDIKWMLRQESKGGIDILFFEISIQDKEKKSKLFSTFNITVTK